MQNKYLLHILFALFLFNATISAQSNEIEREERSWTATQNDQGINVLCSTYEWSGETYLELKFENTTEDLKQFSWTLNVGSESYYSGRVEKIEKHSTLILRDANSRISFRDELPEAFVSINLNFEQP